MVECLTCGGRYEPVGADGVRYFHACPPFAAHEIRAALDAGTLALSVTNRARLKRAQDADAVNPPKPDETTNVDAFLSSLIVERPNKRDENVLTGATKDAPAVIKSAGAGVAELVDMTELDDAGAADVRP